MLKTSAKPRRAKTPLFPCIVLGSSKSSTYPAWEKSCSDSSGLGGWKCYASGFDSPAALLDGLFEHPARLCLIYQNMRTIEFSVGPAAFAPPYDGPASETGSLLYQRVTIVLTQKATDQSPSWGETPHYSFYLRFLQTHGSRSAKARPSI